MELAEFFRLTEEAIMEKLSAEKVKIKLAAIDRDGSLFFDCRVRVNSFTYLKASKLLISGLYIVCSDYIINNLEQLAGEWE